MARTEHQWENMASEGLEPFTQRRENLQVKDAQ